jgi:hypothetical protein
MSLAALPTELDANVLAYCDYAYLLAMCSASNYWRDLEGRMAQLISRSYTHVSDLSPVS